MIIIGRLPLTTEVCLSIVWTVVLLQSKLQQNSENLYVVPLCVMAFSVVVIAHSATRSDMVQAGFALIWILVLIGAHSVILDSSSATVLLSVYPHCRQVYRLGGKAAKKLWGFCV